MSGTRVHAGLVPLLVAVLCAAAEANFSFVGPGFAGFNYTFRDFTQTVQPEGVRISDPVDDSGGAGAVLGSVDLTPFAEGRLVADFATLPGNGADQFRVQLIDVNGARREWSFLASGAPFGVAQRAVSPQTLGSFATSGGGAFDLSAVERFQVLGTYNNPVPFDIDLRSLAIVTDEPAPHPYLGFEADAAWRDLAASRIEANRQADLTVTVVDAAGTPLPNAVVSVRQQEHEFVFGAAVQARRIDSQTPEDLVYQQKFRETFNGAVFENGMKWQAYEGDFGPGFTPDRVDASMAWLQQHEVPVRGHNLVWPGHGRLPNSLRPLLDAAPLGETQQQEVSGRIEDHITEIASRYAGQLSSWDVVNEPRSQRDLFNTLDEGEAAMADWFQAAQAADPVAKRYLNEFGVLDSDGGINSPDQRELARQAVALRDAGAPIDGVGLQGHFRGDSVTGPEQLWKIFDRYAADGFDIQVTEFDHETTDTALQAAYLRDFMTAAFAHEGVSQITQWGFWEDAHWRPDAALFNSDWSLKPNGQAFLDLVYDEWWTDATTTTGADGAAQVRAFRGEHEVEIEFGGEQATAEVVLSADGGALRFELDFVSGDFNRDGLVDTEDYGIWATAYGTQVAAPGLGPDADGDLWVTTDDLNIWATAFVESRTRIQTGNTTPEPAALLQIGLVLAITGTARRVTP